MMRCAPRIVELLLIVFLVFGNAGASKVLAVMEGDTVTFKCSGQASKPLCYVSWATQISGSRTELVTCDNTKDEECKETSHEQECATDEQCQGTALCRQETQITNNSFTSQLIIQNVNSVFRDNFIECIMGDFSHFNSDIIFIMESYSIGVIYQSVNCDATKYDTKVINISCRVTKIYPKVMFRILPEVFSHISNDDQVNVLALTPQLSNITSVYHTLGGSMEYFDAFISTKYYPEKTGAFRFRVEISTTTNPSDPLIVITTNFVTIHPEATNYNYLLPITNTRGIDNKSECLFPKNETDKSIETYKTFYLLIGSTGILAVTTFMMISWAICTKRLSCKLSPHTDNNCNVYESVEDVVVNKDSNGPSVTSPEVEFSQSSEADTLFSYFSDEEMLESSHRLLVAGYVQNGHMHKSHTNCSPDGVCICKDKTYIEPITPTSTLGRSPDKVPSFDPSGHIEQL